MTTVQILKKARKLIEKGWCQGALARDSTGRSTLCISNDAVSFCALGATAGACRGRPSLVPSRDADDILEAAVGLLDPDKSVPQFNDTPGRTKEEMLELYDIAVELAKGVE